MKNEEKNSPKKWVKPEVVDVEGGMEQVETAGGVPLADFTMPVTS